MKPITRYERYLAYLGSDEDANGIDSPVTRIEQYLSKIAGQDVPIPEKPILRIEQYLAKIAGEDVAIPEKPLSRVEMYLAAIAGENVDAPDPITREEWYLKQWAENGGKELTVSGAIVHITNALAKPLIKCEVKLEPIQDLHGQPSPYAAGNGKNKFDKDADDAVAEAYVTSSGGFAKSTSGEKSFVSGLLPAGTYTISKISSSRFRVGVFANDPVPSGTNTPITYLTADPQTATSLTISTNQDGYFAVFAYNGSSETVTVQQILDSLQIESGSSATSYAPYSNICPFTGHTGVTVERTGKNLLDNTRLYNYANWSDSEFKGTYASGNSNHTYRLPTVKGVTYTLSFGISATSYPTYLSLCSADGDTSALVVRYTTESFGRNTYTFTATSEAYYLRLGNTTTESSFNAQMALISYAQLEVGSAATNYDQYSGTTVLVMFSAHSNTVYAGDYDFVSGKLNSAPYYASYNGETLNGHWISDRDVYEEGISPTIGAQVVNDGGTLTEYQLTPHTIDALMGENVIWADAGDVEVTYKAAASDG